MAKNISILGSTGSIGTQTLEVVKEIGSISVKAMSTNVNIDLFEKQIRQFKPELVCVMNEEKAKELENRISDMKITVLSGMEGLKAVATHEKSDTVVNSVVGNIGLEPTAEAIKNKKDIALANKETLVTSGELIMKLVRENNVNMYPVDSEHSAIFQSLQGNEENRIRQILLTASGGPFRKRDSLDDVTVEQALNHPNWSMGKKITIDSATLMNKGLEVIEAKWLFIVPLEKITVVVHPQSIIHSMVEYEDGAIIAQLGVPDMKVPIQYALTYPKRVKNSFEKLDIFSVSSLTFEKPRTDKFRCLTLAYDAIKTGGTMPAVMNAANEIAVAAFLNRRIGFTDIPKVIEKTMNKHKVIGNYTLDDVLNADKEARKYSEEVILCL
ncbi:MAG TPA: 1-deoxy-D-xylulose-5-phosphate reductoisomerase [Lachnospiraceae bacterium]|nr:1-deoxy-D-xylulose-5-phosphate reductoisomerase [Lachnospiraceae bacterium]